VIFPRFPGFRSHAAPVLAGAVGSCGTELRRSSGVAGPRVSAPQVAADRDAATRRVSEHDHYDPASDA
jgi:hypothetical protein